jgi:micrococcal nuclease
MKNKKLWRLWAQTIFIFFCSSLLIGCPSTIQTASNPSEVKVARVVSGQTLEVLGIEQPNLISQVRLIAVDAPDLRQRPWGDDAKQLLETLIGDTNKSVKLELDLEAKDKFGRTLAYVWKDNLFLNEEILKQGYALFGARSPNHKYDRRLERAQQWARVMGQGIWNSDKPMRLTPAEFRRLNR